VKLRQKTSRALLIACALLMVAAPLHLYGASSLNPGNQALDYAVFSSDMTTPLTMDASSVQIRGDLHTNSDFIFKGSSLSISGICKAAGLISVTPSNLMPARVARGAATIL
jgi:hypothetical protein